MRTAQATEIVLDLAAQQWGMVTTAQAKDAGVSAVMLARLVDKAVLERVRSGVYVSTSAGWSSATEIRAQWLALEPKTLAADRLGTLPSAVVSHESAAELHGIGDLDSPNICFTVASRRQTRQPDVTFRTAMLDNTDWTIIDGLPVTTAVRTLIDLARDGHEPEHLADMIGDILNHRLATRPEVAIALVEMAGIFGITPATLDGTKAWLNDRFPILDPPHESARDLQEAVARAIAPLQEQIQRMLNAKYLDADAPSPPTLIASVRDQPALRQVEEEAIKLNSRIQDSLPDRKFTDTYVQNSPGKDAGE